MAEVRENTVQRRTDFKIELIAVFAILVSLGFPGTLEQVYGERFSLVIQYAAFFLEIFVMLFSSGKSWMDIRVVNLEKKYAVLYLFVTVIFVFSMLVTNYPYLEIISCTRLVVTLFFVIWFQDQFRFERMLELLCIAQALFLLAVLYVVVMFPRLAFADGSGPFDMFLGLYPTKNTSACELVFGILIMSVLIHERRKKWKPCRLWIVLWAIQIFLLFTCQATGAVFCLIFSLAMFFIPSRVRFPLGWIYISGNLIFLFATMTLMPAFEWFFEAIGKDATLTGRIPLWNRVLEVMLEHNTLTGFGYGMFWRDPEAYTLIQEGFDEYSFLGNTTAGAHNVLMEYWLNDGLIGIAVFFGAILYSLRRVEEFPEAEYLFCSVFMTFLMINGFTERCLEGNYDYKIFIFLLVLAMGCRLSDEKKEMAEERKGAVDGT